MDHAAPINDGGSGLRRNARALPLGTVALFAVPAVLLGLVHLTYAEQLSSAFADSFQYVHDAHTNLFVVAERAAALRGEQGLFDAKWFHPYAPAASFMEHMTFSGLLYGLLKGAGLGMAAAYNVAAVAILLLNYFAAELLLRDLLGSRTLSVPLAIPAAFSPYAWARYYAPFNTAVFPAVLALVVLRRHCLRPSWSGGIGAPLLMALQFWTAMYVGMFAVILAVVVVPATLRLAIGRGNLARTVVRLGVGLLAAMAALAPIWFAYEGPMRELHPGDSYEYVSAYQRKSASDLWSPAPLTCRLRVVGVVRNPTACAEENFIGWPLVLLVAASAGYLLAVRLRRWRALRASGGLPRSPPAAAVVLTASTAAAFLLGATWPWHLGLLCLLPMRRADGRWRASTTVVLVQTLLLIVGVVLNPGLSFLGVRLQSSFALFHRFVPGMSGIRSEYRIVVFLPLVAALVAGVGWRRLATGWSEGRRRFAAALVLAAALPASLPAWQGFVPVLPDRDSRALAAATALPPQAVLAVMRGKGAGLARPNEAEQASLDSYIVVHGHRTVSGYSGYLSPAARALMTSADLPEADQRVLQSARIARLFGATHMLVGWLGERPPPAELFAAAAPGALRTVAADDRFQLFELVPDAEVAGIVASNPVPPGERTLDATVTTSFPRGAPGASAPPAAYASRAPQQAGDWVAAVFPENRRVSAVRYAVGTSVESLPARFVVEARTEGGWTVVAERSAWSVPEEVIRHPVSGDVRVSFAPVLADAVRLRLVAGAPFPWSLTRFEAGGDP